MTDPEIGAVEDVEPGDEGTADPSEVGPHEDLVGDLELAAAITEAKLATIDDVDVFPRHASCGRNGVVPGGNERVNDAAFTGAANQRSGTIAASSTNCVIRGVLQPSDDAIYHCWTLGNDGFTWSYALNIRTGVRGWTRDNLLRPPPGHTIGGSSFRCGF